MPIFYFSSHSFFNISDSLPVGQQFAFYLNLVNFVPFENQPGKYYKDSRG